MISESMGRGRTEWRKGRVHRRSHPLGYDLDAERRIVASARTIPEIGMTEAEFVRDLFRRFAAGEATINSECLRLTALGVPRGWRYGDSKDRKPKEGDAPRPRREAHHGLVEKLTGNDPAQPGLQGRGAARFALRSVPRVTPALVDAETWEPRKTPCCETGNCRQRTASTRICCAD